MIDFRDVGTEGLIFCSMRLETGVTFKSSNYKV